MIVLPPLLLLLPAVADAPPTDPRIDAVVSAVVRADDAGAAVLVFAEGRLVHARGYGSADPGRRVPVDLATPMRLGSAGKPMVAAAVLLLVERGRLGLDDDLRKHLPGLPAFHPDRPVRVRDLLQHTSGLRDYLTLLPRWNGPREDFGDADLIALLRDAELRNVPGARWSGSPDGRWGSS